MATKRVRLYKRAVPNPPGRRYYDGSTKGVLAAGIGGGSVIGVLTSLFMFMNAAPWASKSEVEALRLDMRRLESSIGEHVNSPGHYSSIAEMATVKTTMTTMQETLKEIKDDVKQIKDRQNGRR